jgi:hypothetical protein
MSAETLAGKYIDAMDRILMKVQRIHGVISVEEGCVNEIEDYVRAYLGDAKYFRDQKKFEASLTSIAYCEGLLDALKLIGAVKISSSP